MSSTKLLTIVVKIGGSTLGSRDTSLADVAALSAAGHRVIVVHGGGKTITEWLEREGVETRFVRGRRVTDAPGLQTVTAVLAGLINKELCAAIIAAGGQALGLSGVDGALVRAEVRAPELGYVGEPVAVDTRLLSLVLDAGFVPVISPLGIGAGPDGALTPLNINADTVAGEMAAALAADMLVFLTDVPGVLDTSGKLVGRMNSALASEMLLSGAAAGGMVPKIEAGVRALAAGAATWIVDGREEHALLRTVEGSFPGTRLVE